MKVDVATSTRAGQEFALDALRRYVWEAPAMKVSEQEQQEYDVAFAKWCEEALPVLKSEYPDEYEKIEAKAKKGRVSRSISAVKDAVRKGLI